MNKMSVLSLNWKVSIAFIDNIMLSYFPFHLMFIVFKKYIRLNTFSNYIYNICV